MNQNQTSTREALDKMNRRVDSLYDQFEQPEQLQYDDYECDENVSEYHPYDPTIDIDTESLEEGASTYETVIEKNRKMSEPSVFKNLCDKFNHKEVVDSEVNDDLAGFINTAFRDGSQMNGKMK